MKKWLAFVLSLVMLLPALPVQAEEITHITLSDTGITVQGNTDAVYTANDIVFYLSGQDFTYGEGGEKDGHTQEEADGHTVVHITQPGTYALSGQMSAGQIAVDVKDGKKDPEAVVTLILNGVDITCTVAPAIIFYNVYECSDADEETATMTVDTTAAGANVIIADDTVNTVNGSYVERIYDPETVKLSEDGTKVEEAKKLHKYDGAFYSKRSMNVSGGEKGNGVLNIHAENEGLDSEMHLTINGGNINIFSGNDGINTNEDNVSVTTLNGGSLNIAVTGETGEGDGIDSNGWLVINGGRLTSAACSFSGDAGIDSDKGIWLNGGDVCATGNMFDHVAGGDEPYAVFAFNGSVKGGSTITLRNEAGETAASWTPVNDFSYLVVSGSAVQPGVYTLWQGDTQLAYTGTTVMAFGGMGGGRPPEMPEGMEMPKDFEGFDPSQMTPPDGAGMPEGMQPPEGFEPPEGFGNPDAFERPEGMEPPTDGRGFGGGRGFNPFGSQADAGEQQTEFVITEDGGSFSGVSAVKD